MLNIPKQYGSLKLVGPISWENIFKKWKELEARQKSWKEHWESRGFSSWDEWREDYVNPLKPNDLPWFLYQITNTLGVLPYFYGVPSKTWVEKAYDGQKTRQLKDILNLTMVKEHPKIIDMRKKFPKKTMLTGIVYQNKIVLVEGMHRSCALAGWDLKIPLKSEVTIALTLWGKTEIPILGGNYK